MAYTGNSYSKMAQDAGAPAAWQNLDYVEEESRPLVVRKGAQHPNGAKLLAIYLAGPEGAKFMLEETGAGNACYPGNYTYDIRMQGKRQGMRIISRDNLMDFYESEDFTKWEKEIAVILVAGGTR